jgi:hypothetical protein
MTVSSILAVKDASDDDGTCSQDIVLVALRCNINFSSSSTEPQKELTPAQIRGYLRSNPHVLISLDEQLLRVDVLAFCLSDAVTTQTEAASADSSTGSSDCTATGSGVPAFIKNR